MGTKPLSPASETSGSTLAAIALTSFSALLLELALTRLFSVVLFYHFAFLAISVALLGLGAGGVFAHLWRNRLTRFATRRLGATLCTANAAAIFLALDVVLHVPVSLELSRWNLFRLTALYLASAVPFFRPGSSSPRSLRGKPVTSPASTLLICWAAPPPVLRSSRC